MCIRDRYRDGLGVPQDYAEGMKWFRRAAEQSYVDPGAMEWFIWRLFGGVIGLGTFALSVYYVKKRMRRFTKGT